ncbi:casein kinase II, regulatory subunit [Pilaira anomala]|nr:casein kinase II, regulatory subunit [Pilaira anomala]
MILDIESEEISEDEQADEKESWVDPNIVEPYAAMLYGLIHQRYLVTRNGLRTMAERFTNEQFGVCPRVYCYKCPVIPCGRYDEAQKESVRLYCPSCMDLYCPPNPMFQTIDGSHFGTTYAHLMFETYTDLFAKPKPHIYQPRIFGFRVNESSRSGPKMQWLRMRPEEYTEQDEVEEDSGKPAIPLQAVDQKRKDETALTDQVEGWKMKDSGFNSLFKRFF